MTEPETQDQTLTTEDEPTTAPEPEPWTPERVSDWNAYYDLYVAAGVLLLVFIVSATKITSSTIWTQLQTGRLIASSGRPVVADPFSYTVYGRPWVNIPWLFEVANSLVYDGLAPASLDRRPGQLTQADQYAAGTLVAINASVRVLTALLLLTIRRRGPGLWWSAVCVCLALGGVFGPPSGLALGGIAGQATVDPDTWGLLLLAIELVILHRAVNLGRPGLIYALIPLFLLWANVDDSFLAGLIVLATTVLGTLSKPGRDDEAQSLSLSRGLVVLGACLGTCLLNPSFHRIYPAALASITRLFSPQVGTLPMDQISVFGPTIRGLLGDLYPSFLAYYLGLVGLGLASFVLNRRRFSLGRFLTFAVVAALWGTLLQYRDEFALVFAVTLALNGQEWYLDRFGAAGRLGRGWALWSVGGRAVTIVLVSLVLVKGLTGFGSLPGEPIFGFGVNPDLFAFEAADTLRLAKIEGNVLNTTLAQGDALIWRAYPARKTFIDGRDHLFPPELHARFDELRRALRDDNVEVWRPMLDRDRISVVMLDLGNSPRTYLTLRQSPNWIHFYDDGNVVMFGRVDAQESDLAYFRENRLDAETLVYRTRRPVESTDRPPRMTTWFDRHFYDRVFQYRYLVPPQPHVRAGSRWLEVDPQSAELPDPAHCLVAVREARTALARKPDDTDAYRLLVEAYRLLMLHESALLAGETLTTANAGRIEPQTGVLLLRFAQRATALNYAIQTSPPPTTEQARESLRFLNFELGQLYLGADMIDLARDRFQDALNLAPPDQITTEFRTRLAELTEQVNETQARLGSLPESAQADPFQRAQLALSLGAVGLALNELNEADQSGVRVAVVRPLLLDLACQTGQPERALDILGNTEDPTLSDGPGSSAKRQGLVSFLLGNYEYASNLWQERAIPQIRSSQAAQALFAGQSFLKGDVREASAQFLELPGRVTTEANWEWDLGLCLLESGEPERAAEHFTKALTLSPEIPVRPVIAYYLEKLGKPVPPPPTEVHAPAQDQETPRPAESEPTAAKEDQAP